MPHEVSWEPATFLPCQIIRARSIRRLSSGAIGAIGAIGAAGLIVMALASAYSARPAQAVIPDQSELSAFAKAVERRGTLYGLEIMF
jgi:hypothetical protein